MNLLEFSKLSQLQFSFSESFTYAYLIMVDVPKSSKMREV